MPKPKPRIQEGAVGLIFRARWRDQKKNLISLIGATTLEMEFKKPDLNKFLRTAFLPGGKGLMDYVSIALDLNAEGDWEVQGHFITPTLDLWGPVHKFEVFANITDIV